MQSSAADAKFKLSRDFY